MAMPLGIMVSFLVSTGSRILALSVPISRGLGNMLGQKVVVEGV